MDMALILLHTSFSSVQFSRSVVSDSLQPRESQRARPPCPSPTPWVYSNSCLSSRWCHPAISSSIVPFSSCPQSFPASGSFPMSQLFAWGSQSYGVSASASVLPMNTQDWSPLGWTGWIAPWKHKAFWLYALYFDYLLQHLSGVHVSIHDFPGGTLEKNLPANAGGSRDKGSIPGLGRSPGGKSGNPLQYSCLENPMDGGI